MDVNESDKMSSSFSAFSGFYACRLDDMPLQSVSALCVITGTAPITGGGFKKSQLISLHLVICLSR